jgi:hypothetical protein
MIFTAKKSTGCGAQRPPVSHDLTMLTCASRRSFCGFHVCRKKDPAVRPFAPELFGRILSGSRKARSSEQKPRIPSLALFLSFL